jgi:hypothetical protein
LRRKGDREPHDVTKDRPGVFLDRADLRIVLGARSYTLTNEAHPWIGRIVTFLRKERIRFRRAFPPKERVKKRDEQNETTLQVYYARRQNRLSIRYFLYACLLLIAITQIWSVVGWSWINPFEVFGELGLLILAVALSAFIFQNIGGLIVVVARTALGLDAGAAARKYRNSVYIITLSYFALVQRDALADIAVVIPFETLQTEPDIENLIILATAYVWLNYLLERYFDSDQYCKTPQSQPRFASSAIPVSVISGGISFTFNTLLPAVLTWAMLSTFSFSALETIAGYLVAIGEVVAQADIPFVSPIVREILEPP